MWRPSQFDADAVRRFFEAREKHGLTPLVIDDSYLINLPAADPVVRTRSIAAFRGEIERALALWDRTAAVKDVFGNQWYLATHLPDTEA